MKTKYYLLTVLILTGVIVFSSCSKKSATKELQPITISFVSSQGYIYQNTDLPMNSAFRLGLTANADAENGAVLTHMTITALYLDKPIIMDSILNTSHFTMDVEKTTLGLVGQQQWTFKFTDSKGQVKETGFTITTTAK